MVASRCLGEVRREEEWCVGEEDMTASCPNESTLKGETTSARELSSPLLLALLERGEEAVFTERREGIGSLSEEEMQGEGGLDEGEAELRCCRYASICCCHCERALCVEALALLKAEGELVLRG